MRDKQGPRWNQSGQVLSKEAHVRARLPYRFLAAVVVSAMLLTGCVLHTLVPKPARPGTTHPSVTVVSSGVQPRYAELRGIWDVKLPLPQQGHGTPQYEHLRFVFNGDQAYLQSFSPVRAIVKLNSRGQVQDAGPWWDVLVFEFDALESQAEPHHRNSALSTGVARVMLATRNTNRNIQVVFGRNGRRGELLRPPEDHAARWRSAHGKMFYYRDWSEDKNRRSEETYEQALKRSFDALWDRYGFRCISQTNFSVRDDMPHTVVDQVDLSGPILYMIASSNAGKDLTYTLGAPSGGKHMAAPSAYPVLSYGSGFHQRFVFHFQHRPHTPDDWDVRPPADVTLFLLTRTPGDDSTTPCRAEFRKYFIAPEVKIFFALLSNEAHKRAYADKNYGLALVMGLSRNELMSAGLSERFPRLSSSDADTIGRMIVSIADADPVDFGMAPLWTRLYDSMVTSVRNTPDETLAKIADVIADMLWRRARQ